MCNTAAGSKVFEKIRLQFFLETLCNPPIDVRKSSSLSHSFASLHLHRWTSGLRITFFCPSSLSCFDGKLISRIWPSNRWMYQYSPLLFRVSNCFQMTSFWVQNLKGGNLMLTNLQSGALIWSHRGHKSGCLVCCPWKLKVVFRCIPKELFPTTEAKVNLVYMVRHRSTRYLVTKTRIND